MKSKKLSEKIIKTFKSNGFILSEPDILLDSEYIIQRSGENFKRLMFTFENEDGKLMCLRPDLTVASCIKYLKKKSNSKIYYSGQAYRRSGNNGSDLINEQLGIEILGSKNQIKDEYSLIASKCKSKDGQSRQVSWLSKRFNFEKTLINVFNSFTDELREIINSDTYIGLK